MAMRAATMNSMSPYDTPQPARPSDDSLSRKLVLLLLLIGAAVLWIVIWFRQEADFPLLLSTFFADASLGLIAGFGSRIFLRNRDGFVRVSVAILIAVIGMYMIGALTKWVLGVGPIVWEQEFAKQLETVRFNRNFFNQLASLRIGSRVLFDFSKLNWADGAHLAVSLMMTVLALQAWRRTRATALPVQDYEPVYEPVEIAPMPTPHVSSPRRSRRITASSNGRSRANGSSGRSARARVNSRPRERVHSNNGSRAMVKTMEPVLRPKKKRLFQPKSKIQLAMVEEHRCPYCLDPVSRNDPRGVKECDVCHTLHHADCWAITGVCQVPHLNT
ncbi:MAG TPA: hypothetical protein VKP08_16275 [Anaerolineales bacterium]|nr:hypothetical protein [Anaerolineales bacterium]